VAQFGDVFWGSLCLAIEECRDGYFIATEFFSNRFKGERFNGFSVEEGFGGGGEAVNEGGLIISFG
jgi:hypothetical protein